MFNVNDKANNDLEFDQISLYIVSRDSSREGYTSEHGPQISPFRKRAKHRAERAKQDESIKRTKLFE